LSAVIFAFLVVLGYLDVAVFSGTNSDPFSWWFWMIILAAG